MSSATTERGSIRVRNTEPRDFARITAISQKVYPSDEPWLPEHLEVHLSVFPEGQFVAVDADDQVIGMAASLILSWDDYDRLDNYNDLTDSGYFHNHDPSGRTLYGAERSEEHTSELQSRGHLVCRLLLEKKNKSTTTRTHG